MVNFSIDQWSHSRITWKALKYADAQAAFQTNEMRISRDGTEASQVMALCIKAENWDHFMGLYQAW